VERIEDALRGLGEDAESTDLRLMLTNNRLTYLAVLGRWREAEAALPAALMLPERAGTFRAAGLVATAAEISYLHGTWDEALVHISGISTEFLGLTSNLTAPALGMPIALRRGQRNKADAHLRADGVTESSVAALARVTPNWRLAAAWALRAEVDGDLHRALYRLAILLDPIHPPSQQTRQEMMPHLVRLALAAGDRTAAAAAADVSRVTAARCTQAQLDDDADALLNAADHFDRHGWPLQRAIALEEAAVRLAVAGETTRARPAFTDALRTYFDLGATWDRRRMEAWRRGCGPTASGVAPARCTAARRVAGSP
jgi:hypothetical protein